MSRRNEYLFALNAGGVDTQALGRVDLEKLRLAGEHPVTNWLPRVLGPMSVRPGTEFIDTVSEQGRMIEFVRSADTTALLWCSNQSITIYDDDEPVQVVNSSSTIANPTFGSALSGAFTTGWKDDSETGDGTDGTASVSGGVLTLTATKYRSASVQQSVAIAGGDQAKAHTVRIVVSRGPVYVRMGTTQDAEDLLTEQRLLTGTHKLTVTPNASALWIKVRSEDPVARIVTEVRFEHTALGGAGDLTLPTPWTTARLEFLSWAQEHGTDVVFVGDGTVQQRRIERRGAASWSIVLYETKGGPFQAPSTDKVLLTPDVLIGNGTLTSNLTYFNASHVGTLFELTHPQQQMGEELNGADQATDKVTVSGLFSSTKTFDDRNMSLIIDFTTGSFVGDIALERSTDTDALTWSVVDSYPHSGGDISASYNDEQSNLIAHYRWRVTSYTSGYAVVQLGYVGGSKTGTLRVTEFTSSTSVEYEVVTPLGNTAATRTWRAPMWSDDLGWPRVPQFRDGRLHWFLQGRDFASIVDDWNNFDDAREGDSGPIIRFVGGEVRWALDMDRLVIGSAERVSAIQASDFNEVVTPTSFTVRPGPTVGANYVRPGQVDDVAVISDKTGTRVYEIAVPDGAAKLKSADLSRLIPNAFSQSIVDIAVQRQPDTRVYCVLGDGTCLVLTYERDDKVVAWTLIETSGLIKDVAILPGSRQDNVYLTVYRSGLALADRYRIEKIANEADQRALATCVPLDGAVIATGSVSSITEASLASQTVHLFADGLYRGTKVANGSGVVSLGATYSRAVIGFAFEAEFTSVKLAYAAQLGTAIGQQKQVRRVAPILSNSVLDALVIGRDESNVEALPGYYKGVARTSGQFFTHWDDESFSLPGSWDTDARLYLKVASQYGPVTLQAIAIDVETREGVNAPSRND